MVRACGVPVPVVPPGYSCCLLQQYFRNVKMIIKEVVGNLYIMYHGIILIDMSGYF